MRNIWLKIGLGATGVFAVGMMGLTLARQARAAATDAFHDAVGKVPAALASAVHSRAGVERLAALQDVGGSGTAVVSVPFRLDGRTIGVVHSGSIRRVRADALPTVQLDVELTVDDAADLLDDCILVPLKHHDSDFTGGFRCADGDDADLVTFGRVSFEPLRNSRPIMLTSDQAAELEHGDPFEATADLRGRVNVHARGEHGGLVRVQADDQGANIRINDEFGRDIFRLMADSLGASLRVRDKNGRDIVRLEAGDGRLSLNVDTAGH